MDRELFSRELRAEWDDRRHPIPWEAAEREWLPMPGVETDMLLSIAGQPGNYKSSKRGLFILLYALGAPRDDILAILKVSERSLERWFYRWIEDGIDGVLRLHDTTRREGWLSLCDPALAEEMRRALHRVRTPRLPELDQNGAARVLSILGSYLDEPAESAAETADAARARRQTILAEDAMAIDQRPECPHQEV